jgi:hypothetical protein
MLNNGSDILWLEALCKASLWLGYKQAMMNPTFTHAKETNAE